MSSHGVSALERGYRRTPQRETLALLADALELGEEQRRDFHAAAARWVLLRRGAGTSVTIGPWAGSESSNLPFALSSFVGRDAELDAILDLIREHRLITLTGAGGVGKTQMALHAANALSHDPNDAVWFVGLAPIRDPSLVIATIASTLGVQEVPGRPLFETLCAGLRNKALFLVLDNCEHVIAEAAKIAEGLLAVCPRVRILATSREPLRAAGEYTYRVPSLNIPDAIALFADRAQAADHRFALTNESTPLVEEICRRLDGIPFAIELAAARVRVLTIRDIARRLDERFKILTGNDRTEVPRQRTLSALIDWSFELLKLKERQLFTRLGIFRSGFSLQAAASVCGATEDGELEVLELLESLTDKSLVVADTSGEHARYRLLESTAVYALNKLNALGERDLLARRHAEYFSKEVLALREHFGTASFPSCLHGIEGEIENCRTALEWSLTGGNDAILGATIAGEATLWAHAGLAAEGRYWIGLGLERVSETEHPEAAARLRLALCNFSSGKHKHDEGQRAIRLYGAAGDAWGVASARRQAAFGLFQMRRLDEARAIAEQALVESQECGNLLNAAQCLDLLAYVLSDQGDRRAARDLHAKALAAFKELGDESGAGLVLGNLAELEFADGNPKQALRLVSEALEISLRGKNAMDIAMFYANRAAYCIRLDDAAAARLSAREALTFARQAQSELNTAIGLQHLAVLAVLGGDAALAARLSGYVESQFNQLGYAREGTEQWGSDVLARQLREALSEDDIATLAAEGARWSEDRAVAESLLI